MLMQNRAATSDMDKAVGIVGIVLGGIVLLDDFTLPWILPLLGLVLIGLGVLLVGRFVRGSGTLGVVLIVLGALLLSPLLGIPAVAARALHLVVGAALLVIGIVKLS